MIYIVAYDISSNKRRTRVAKALQSWGYRIQESVFQLRLDAAGLNAMRARLAALINEAEDVVHIYPLCSTCAERAEILGAAVALDDVGLCRGVWWVSFTRSNLVRGSNAYYSFVVSYENHLQSLKPCVFLCVNADQLHHRSNAGGYQYDLHVRVVLVHLVHSSRSSLVETPSLCPVS